jgi:hypothetical protein
MNSLIMFGSIQKDSITEIEIQIIPKSRTVILVTYKCKCTKYITQYTYYKHSDTTFNKLFTPCNTAECTEIKYLLPHLTCTQMAFKLTGLGIRYNELNDVARG